MTDIQTRALHDALFALQDTDYKAFHEKLIPTVPPETVIGIPHAGFAAFRFGLCQNARRGGISCVASARLL